MKKGWKGTGFGSPTKGEMDELYKWLIHSDWVQSDGDGAWELTYLGHKLLILLNEIKKKGSHKIIYTTYEDSFGVTRLGELLATVWFNTFCKGKGRFK